MRAALPAFIGDIQQVPSAVSAIKVDGKRAYARVRAVRTSSCRSRRVTVSELELGRVRPAARSELDVATSLLERHLRPRDRPRPRRRARRRWAPDRAAADRVGPFGLDQAHTLEQLERELRADPLAEAARAASRPSTWTAEPRERRFGRKLAGIDLARRAGGAVRAGRGVPGALRARDGGARAVAVFV